MPLTVCPKCQVMMETQQRQGVQVDICPQCRGVWLDRGELEQLLFPLRQNESLWHEVNQNYFAKSGRDMPINPFTHVLNVFR